MSRRDVLGLCPECGASVPRPKLLIEYERDGRQAMFVECPDCRGIVRPDPISVPSLDPG